MAKLARIIAGTLALSLMAAGPGLAQRAKLEPPAGTPMATSHLNPNRATAAQLRAAAPFLSPALAQEIVAKRPYKTQLDFAKVVSGKVAAGQIPALYAAVFVPISLNNASRDEIMTIPGMTGRMAHEFEEYRPYKDIAQFDREIGKYVNPPEVARLRSYVSLP
jgi:DNA uptake protein ComE-like DNA-binding protein